MTETTDPELMLYEDGDHVVLCDRSNPNAWIRSDTTVEVERSELAENAERY